MSKFRSLFPGIFVVIPLFILSGCSGIRSAYPRQGVFRITAGSWETPRPALGAGLLVRLFEISPEFESTSFVFQVSRDRFKEDFYNRFMVSPARMITHAVREDLTASPFFKTGSAREPQAVPFRLQGKVIDLYADIRDPQAPRAVMSVRLVLEKQKGQKIAPVLNQTYPAQVSVRSMDAADFTTAWNLCLKQILSGFYRDVKALNSSESPLSDAFE